MSSKKFLPVFLGALMLFGPLTTTAKAELTNQDCIEVYRNGYLDLRDLIKGYNAKTIEKGQFVAGVTANSTDVRALRAACWFVESPNAEACVEDYKELYSGLRDRVRLRSVLAGNQESITFTDDSSNTRSSIEDDGNVIRRFWRGLRNESSDAIKLGKMAVIDAKCL